MSAGGTSTTGQGGTGGGSEGGCEVMPLTDEFRQAYDDLDPFYQKYADAGGLPVVSSLSPADETLTRVCELVIDMTSARPDALEALIAQHVRFAVIGEDELTNDIPEFAYLDDYINQRARRSSSIAIRTNEPVPRVGRCPRARGLRPRFSETLLSSGAAAGGGSVSVIVQFCSCTAATSGSFVRSARIVCLRAGKLAGAPIVAKSF